MSPRGPRAGKNVRSPIDSLSKGTFPRSSLCEFEKTFKLWAGKNAKRKEARPEKRHELKSIVMCGQNKWPEVNITETKNVGVVSKGKGLINRCLQKDGVIV